MQDFMSMVVESNPRLHIEGSGNDCQILCMADNAYKIVKIGTGSAR